jgi:hypothetical protein
MAHYAFLDENNVVTEVIVGRDENDLVEGVTSWEEYYGEFRGQKCVRTSYNTLQGQHVGDGEPFRGNYAGIGFTYDEDLDAFIPPSPFPSWVLNEDTFSWDAPIPYPSDGKKYKWDESAGVWVEVEDEAG